MIHYLLSKGPLAWKNFVREDRNGAASIFHIKCKHCGAINKVSTSKQHSTGQRGPKAYDINSRIALGALNAGIGQTHVNSLLSCLDVPSINHVTFKVREREVGKVVESVAEASCMESCCEERKRAVAAGAQCDEKDLVGILVSYDMGWQKRGKAYNSPTGHGAVPGVSTGKVLDFATRCKTCRVCSAAKGKPKPHDC